MARQPRVPIRDRLAVLLSPGEWVLMAALVGVPVALGWRFASESYFFQDDIYNLYLAHIDEPGLTYAFAENTGHLAPGFRMVYMALDRVGTMEFGLALGFVLACHAISTVLLQRILALLFGRVWWTYALAFAWAISVIYVTTFANFSGALHPIPEITATLASIHGYLCWRATRRRAWLAWSLIAMGIGLGFYERALFIPIYLLLMRLLLLDPTERLSESLRSIRDEWRVWLAYAAVSGLFLVIYLQGSYGHLESAGPGEVLRYLRIFWVDNFWPTVFGVVIPERGPDTLDRIIPIAAQVALLGLVAWSVFRRRAAWRAWAFLTLGIAVNALSLYGRVAEWGPEAIGHAVRYSCDPAVLVPLAIAFAFAEPQMRAAGGIPLTGRSEAAPGPRRLRLPGAGAASVAILALGVYATVTVTTANSFLGAGPGLYEQFGNNVIPVGRASRAYLDNLRADLVSARKAETRPSLLDHSVPAWLVSPLFNLDPDTGPRSTLLSSVVPIFDDRVSFNRHGELYVVQNNGHLERTGFLPAAGGRIETLLQALRIRAADVRRRPGELCVSAEGSGASLETSLRPLPGRDLWLRARYRTDRLRSVGVQSSAGPGWADEPSGLPAMRDPGTAFARLTEFPGAPAIAGVRLLVPTNGTLCLRSLETGSFQPEPPSPNLPPDAG